MSAGQLLELLRGGTRLFPVWFSRNCSTAVKEFWGWAPVRGEVWLASLVSCMFSSLLFFYSIWIANSILTLCSLWWLLDVSERCCQTTSGIGGNFVSLVISGLSSAVPEWRCGIFGSNFRPQPRHLDLQCSVCPVVDSDSVPLVQMCDRIVFCQNNCWLCCFPQIIRKLKKFHVSSQKFFWVNGHLELCGGENFRVKRHGGCTFSALTVSFDRDCLQSWGNIQHFWSWQPSIGRALFLEWFVQC